MFIFLGFILASNDCIDQLDALLSNLKKMIQEKSLIQDGELDHLVTQDRKNDRVVLSAIDHRNSINKYEPCIRSLPDSVVDVDLARLKSKLQDSIYTDVQEGFQYLQDLADACDFLASSLKNVEVSTVGSDQEIIFLYSLFAEALQSYLARYGVVRVSQIDLFSLNSEQRYDLLKNLNTPKCSVSLSEILMKRMTGAYNKATFLDQLRKYDSRVIKVVLSKLMEYEKVYSPVDLGEDKTLLVLQLAGHLQSLQERVDLGGGKELINATYWAKLAEDLFNKVYQESYSSGAQRLLEDSDQLFVSSLDLLFQANLLRGFFLYKEILRKNSTPLFSFDLFKIKSFLGDNIHSIIKINILKNRRSEDRYLSQSLQEFATREKSSSTYQFILKKYEQNRQQIFSNMHLYLDLQVHSLLPYLLSNGELASSCSSFVENYFKDEERVIASADFFTTFYKDLRIFITILLYQQYLNLF